MERGWRELGLVIRTRRVAAGLTQEELAERCESHFTYISEIETGKVSPSIVVLRRIARALGMPASQLIEDAEALEGDQTSV
ncbi:MAG: helix-turn-helix domain-containing protein [Fimbriimonadaceae bacterium]|nr:helix-turn-helix domain-containing protein [Fimbriimonadaceae bacterium]